MANRNINATTPSEAMNSALAYYNADTSIQRPNGTFLVEAGCARDQAALCAANLAGLLSLMHIDAAKGFFQLTESNQQQLLWMAAEMAEEVQAVLPLAFEEAGSVK